MSCPICQGHQSKHPVRDLVECWNCGHRRRREIPTVDELKKRTKGFQLSATRDKERRRQRLVDARGQLKSLALKPGMIYDVGAAGGFFLKAAQDAGWKGWGNELSVAAIEFAKKVYEIPLDYGVLEEINLLPEIFDAVMIWNTLEHCIDPLTTLQTANRILKPGGVLMVSVPNKRESELKATYAGGHLSEFTEESMDLCASNAGFQLDWLRNRQARHCRQVDGRWVCADHLPARVGGSDPSHAGAESAVVEEAPRCDLETVRGDGAPG